MQACRGAFCTPRVNDFNGDYTKVEVALISGEEDLLAGQFKVLDNENNEEYYPNVPIELVDAIAEKHGGIAMPLESVEGEAVKVKSRKKDFIDKLR